ncbi:MAG: DivIVA domain-containing protein [Actinomycetota bacterium]|nr:DivIVA domain-containing protein [Actinomycetota bacterium]
MVKVRDELLSEEFDMAFRGYDRNQVRGFLESMAFELERRDREIADLKRELAAKQEPDRNLLLKQLGDEVVSTLEAADRLKTQAQEQANQIRYEAREEAEQVRAEAEQEAATLRQGVEEILDALGDVQAMLGELVVGMRKEVSSITELPTGESA